MSRTKQAEQIIIKIMSDGEWHELQQIKSTISQQNEELVEKSNLVNVLLSRMCNKDKILEKGERGKYRLRNDEQKKYESQEDSAISKKVLTAWEECYKSILGGQKLSYDLTEEEFRIGKKLNKFNNDIQKWIKAYNFSEE